MNFKLIIKDAIAHIKNEKYGLAIVFGLLCLLIYFSWWKWGIFSSCDNARELIDIYFINNGLIPYKDFYYDYPPVVAYILTFISYIAGYKLYIFFGFSLFLISVFVIVFYTTARLVLNKFYASIATCLFISQAIFFNKGMYSYLLPYSYNAVVASIFFTLLLLCCLQHLKTNNNKYLVWASVCIFACTLTKQDFTISIVTAFCLYLVIYFLKINDISKLKEAGIFLKKIKEYFFSIKPAVLFLFIILLPGLFYLIYGAFTGYGPMIECLIPFKKYDSSSVNAFSSEFLWGYPTPRALGRFIKFAFTNILFYGSLVGLTYLLISGFKFIKSHKNSLLIICIITFAFLGVFFGFGLVKPLASLCIAGVENTRYYYSGINFWLTILFFAYLFTLKKHNNYTLILLTAFSMIVTYRTFFGLDLMRYTFYYLPVPILTFTYLLTIILPESTSKYKQMNLQTLKTATNIFLIGTIFFFSYIVKAKYSIKTYHDETPLGTVYFTKYHYNEYKLMKEVAEYIKENTTKKDTILALPNAIPVYILTDRLPASRYYLLIAGYATKKEEERSILDDIKRNKPAIIALSNEEFLEGFFKDMFPDVYNYILKNYEEDITFQNIFEGKLILEIKIFKLKPHQPTSPVVS